jgi:hypothetical protein
MEQNFENYYTNNENLKNLEQILSIGESKALLPPVSATADGVTDCRGERPALSSCLPHDKHGHWVQPTRGQ